MVGLMNFQHITAQEAPPRVDVFLQVTSGMANPNWFFDDPDNLDTLRSLIRGLAAAPEVAEPQFGAFRLAADQARCQFPESVLVFGGTIKATTSDGTVKFFVDEKVLEQFLRDSAVAAGFGPQLP